MPPPKSSVTLRTDLPTPAAPAPAGPTSSSSTSPPKSIIIHRIDPDHYASNAPSANSSPTPSTDDSNTPQILTTTQLTAATSSSVSSSSTPVIVASSPVPAPPLTLTQRALAEASSGLGGAIFSACCVYPLDLVKTRLQLPNAPYNSLTSGFTTILREEGFLTLYTGLSSELIKTSVQNFLYFYWYIIFKESATVYMTKQQQKQLVPAADDIKRKSITFSGTTQFDPTRHRPLGSDSEYHQRSQLVTLQVAEWRIKAELRRRRAAAAGITLDPSLTPSISDPNLAGLGGHDIDDSPYVDIKSAEQSTLVTNTATVLTAPATSKVPPPPVDSSSSSIQPVQLSIGLTLLLGTLAGCITQLVVNPVSVIQTRMMIQKRVAGGAALPGFFAMATKIFHEQGLTAFYAGILPSFILSTNPSIQFLVFDRLKSLILRILSHSMLAPRSLSIFESFILGAFSKIVATLVTYPYIIAKIRLAAQSKSDTSGLKYSGTLDVIFRTLKYEGIAGLFSGLQAQLLKSVLGAALMFMAKEKIADFVAQIQQWLERRSKSVVQEETTKSEITTTTATTKGEPRKS